MVEHLKAFLGHLILLREERFIFLRKRGFVGTIALDGWWGWMQTPSWPRSSPSWPSAV
jgi:hypothetical protein